MKHRPRILYIGNKLSSAGSTPTTIDTLGAGLEAEGYSIQYASSKRNQAARLADMLCQIVKNRKADVVLIDTYSTLAFYFAWASARLAALLGIKYISLLHGGALPARFSRSRYMSRQLFANSYTNVAVSPYLEDCLRQHAYAHVLIPNSIDIKQYIYNERSVFRPKLLWVRAFHKTYDPEMAIRLLKLLSAQYPEAILTMVGPEKDGSLENCKRLAKELGVQNKICFTGMLAKKDWRALATEHDIFINTSRFDNMPVSVIEAMALGLPVVSTEVGGLRFMISDGVDGYLVKQNNEHSMLESITYVIENVDKTRLIARQARKKAEGFDWEVIKKEWINLLDKVMDNKEAHN